jgi:hypothetical protein
VASVPGSKAPVDDAVLRPGDRVRVAFDFARRVGRHPTAVLTVATITRTESGVTILGLRWAPSAQPGGPEVAASDAGIRAAAGRTRAQTEDPSAGT